MFLSKSKSLMAGLAAIFSLAYGPVFAEKVTLNSLDGSVSMTGELLNYDGNTYLLGMLVGDISIDAAQVTCEGAACPNLAADLKEFTIAGSGEMGNTLLPTLIEVFALDRGGDLEVSTDTEGNRVYKVLEADGTVFASITLKASDSQDGFASLLEGSAAIGMTTRRANTNEIAAFGLSGKGKLDTPAQEQIVAMDGVVVVVNPQNPVQILSFAQLSGIFDGEITNWQQVGGPDVPITVYRMAETADTTAAFYAAAMAAGNHAFTSNAKILRSNAAVSDAVAADVNGIGISSYAQERNARSVTIRSVCGELFTPSEFSIKTESYPLTRRLYLYTTEKGLPDSAAAFLAFATAPSTQSVIRNTGFVDQSVAVADLDAQGRRLAQAIVSSSGRTELLQLQDLTSIMLDADRLSFTLHYDSDGRLDARAVADIDRLAALIKSGTFSSRQMLVLGFSDNAGAVNAQLVATQAIAQDVRDRIVNATGRANLGNLRISPIGYGRLMPLGCNETPAGRSRNNRVEIWVK